MPDQLPINGDITNFCGEAIWSFVGAILPGCWEIALMGHYLPRRDEGKEMNHGFSVG